jgi:hypothetical protein
MISITKRIESNTQIDARYSGDFWITHRCQGGDSDEMWTLATSLLLRALGFFFIGRLKAYIPKELVLL